VIGSVHNLFKGKNMSKAHTLSDQEVLDQLIAIIELNKTDPVAALTKTKEKFPNWNFNAQNETGDTILHYAADNNYYNVVRFLIITAKVNIKIQNQEGATALHLAAQNNNIEIVNFLASIDQKLCVERTTEEGLSPLHIAVMHGYLKVAKTLAAHSMDSIDRCNKYGDTPLSVAAMKGNYEIVELLTKEYESSLKCWHNHPGIMRLIESKNDKGITALHHAAAKGHCNIVKFLKEQYNADINNPSKYGMTALSTAVENNQIEVVKLLLKYKANINTQETERSYTPLHSAVILGNLEMVKILVKAGADLTIMHNHKDPNSEASVSLTPLQLTDLLKNPNREVVKFLETETAIKRLKSQICTKQPSANINIELKEIEKTLKEFPDLIKWTSETNNQSFAHYAAAFGHLKILELLIFKSKGEIIKATDSKGFTPLDYALRANNVEAAALLLKKGAKLESVKTKSYQGVLEQAQNIIENEKLNFEKVLIHNCKITKLPHNWQAETNDKGLYIIKVAKADFNNLTLFQHNTVMGDNLSNMGCNNFEGEQFSANYPITSEPLLSEFISQGRVNEAHFHPVEIAGDAL